MEFQSVGADTLQRCASPYPVLSKETKAKTEEVKNCLQNCFQIDDAATQIILDKLSPLLKDTDSHAILDQFIKMSQALKIDFCPCENPILPEDDGVIKAPDQHVAIFDSSSVRVLWSTSKRGDYEPFHRHLWPRIIIAMEDVNYEVTDGRTGLVKTEECLKGVYWCGPDEYYACENLGPGIERCIGIEIKTLLAS